MDFERSIAFGYLPKEVPDSFSSEPFSKVAKGLTLLPSGKNWTTPVRFSLAKAGGLRRQTEIPNPLSQVPIAELCSTNWRTLQRLTAASPISLSRPVRDRRTRSLAYLVELQARPEAMIGRMPGGAFTLKTDVTQFYPSVYTHAVDWAVRTKAVAKRRMKSGGLGPTLDRRLRESRGGQTVGLSVGPDTSWLVSELVLARVDAAICKRHPGVARRAVRFGDDMTFYAGSEAEAHEVLADYETALAAYELALNPIKVTLLPGLNAPEPPWVALLRGARFRDDSEAHQTQDLVDLFALAFSEVLKNPTQGVLSYAIKRCNPFPSGERSWPVYRDLVLASVTQEPSAVRHVYDILHFANEHGLSVETDRLIEILNETCAKHARFDHGYEVAWLLSIMRSLKLPLESSVAQEVAEMQDNCSLVLLMDMASRSAKLKSAVDFNKAVKRAEVKGALTSEDWLLAYESRASGWCTPKAWDNLDGFKQLHAAKVRFLVDASVRPPSRLRRWLPRFMPTWY